MTSLSLDIAHSLPEIVLAIGALSLLMLGAFGAGEARLDHHRGGDRRAWHRLPVDVLSHRRQGAGSADQAFIDDNFARFMKTLVLLGSMTTLILSREYLARHDIAASSSFPCWCCWRRSACACWSRRKDLIALYLGLELMSLALYVIAAFHRDDVRASEAGLKYFVLGALSSGMLLYGSSLIYGYAGTVSFTGIAAALQGDVSIGVIFGLVFVLAGLAFKMSSGAVPHVDAGRL